MDWPERGAPEGFVPIPDCPPGGYYNKATGAAYFNIREIHRAWGLPSTEEELLDTLRYFKAIAPEMGVEKIIVRMPDGTERRVE